MRRFVCLALLLSSSTAFAQSGDADVDKTIACLHERGQNALRKLADRPTLSTDCRARTDANDAQVKALLPKR